MFLLDTNVLSELRKWDRCNSAVRSWFENTPEDQLHVSVITITEIMEGALSLQRRDPIQGDIITRWAGRVLAGRIVVLDTAIALASARTQVPNRRPVNDSYIAAKAIVHGMTLVTRNTRDFVGLEAHGLRLLDPWQIQDRPKGS